MSDSIIRTILASQRRPTPRTQEVVEYLFCHQELLYTAKLVMSGYKPDEHIFIDPGENIQDYYERFQSRYEELRSNEYVQQLPLTDLRGFALAERNIGLWSRFEEIEEEFDLVSMYVPNESYVHNDRLLVVSYQLRKMLKEFEEYKAQELERMNPKKFALTISFNTEASTVVINGKSYETSLTARELIFLRLLVERVNKPYGYQTLAHDIGMPKSKNYLTATAANRFVQDIKNKYLPRTLSRMKVPKKIVKLIFEAIQTMPKVGYKFVPPLL